MTPPASWMPVWVSGWCGGCALGIFVIGRPAPAAFAAVLALAALGVAYAVERGR